LRGAGTTWRPNARTGYSQYSQHSRSTQEEDEEISLSKGIDQATKDSPEETSTNVVPGTVCQGPCFDQEEVGHQKEAVITQRWGNEHTMSILFKEVQVQTGFVQAHQEDSR